MTLLNAVIDLESFSDDEEQAILKHATLSVASAIERALPRTFLRLVQEPSTEEGLEAGQAYKFRQRLCEQVRESCSLPYLPPKQELQLVQCVVALAVESMRRGCTYDSVLEVERAGPILMECFIKGNAGSFFHERAAVVDTLADDLDVPLLPASWKRKACARVVDELAALLERAMMRVYEDSWHTVARAADANARAADAAAKAASAAAAAAAATAAAAADADTAAADAKAAKGVAAEAAAAAEAATRAEARELSTPFDVRVRSALTEELVSRLGVLGSSGVLTVVRQAVDLALDASLDASEMNGAATYLLDQHRLARRLAAAPVGARELLLKKKEQVLCAVLSFDDDGDGEVDRAEFGAGLAALGLTLRDDEIDALFATLDADGSGAIVPAELESLLYGRPLDDDERHALLRAHSSQLRHGADVRAKPKASIGSFMKLLPLYLVGRIGQAAEERGAHGPAHDAHTAAATGTASDRHTSEA